MSAFSETQIHSKNWLHMLKIHVKPLIHHFSWLKHHFLWVKRHFSWLNHHFLWVNHNFSWLNHHSSPCLLVKSMVQKKINMAAGGRGGQGRETEDCGPCRREMRRNVGRLWKCWVNIPNEIAIFHRDNDQQNHWVQWGFLYFQTNPFVAVCYWTWSFMDDLPIQNGDFSTAKC